MICYIFFWKYLKLLKFVIFILINIKVGLPDHIYTTPYKEDDNDDYGCYIKLNGTVKKIAGESLFYYTKNKIMKYIKNLAEKQNNANFINNN